MLQPYIRISVSFLIATPLTFVLAHPDQRARKPVFFIDGSTCADIVRAG